MTDDPKQLAEEPACFDRMEILGRVRAVGDGGYTALERELRKELLSALASLEKAKRERKEVVDRLAKQPERWRWYHDEEKKAAVAERDRYRELLRRVASGAETAVIETALLSEIEAALLPARSSTAECICGGGHSAYVDDRSLGAGHAVNCPVRIAHPYRPARSSTAEEKGVECGKTIHGLYGPLSTCARPRGHTGRHDSIWREDDWLVHQALDPEFAGNFE